MILGEPLMSFVIEPRLEMDLSNVLPQEIEALPLDPWCQFEQLSENAKRKIEKTEIPSSKKGPYVVPLGTGSAIPGKYRNGRVICLMSFHSILNLFKFKIWLYFIRCW